ncbi:hypothetical protein GCM10011386_07760 [Parapedobacter defluvii]|uniref:Uncharacterized protein n=2 Tax=Parapedobacter defluvii TaxID=2045106 RepID=A0ABQ1L2C3_9SPHI|nr:hypothetical protein GCM10011386_07760 [Parapedobacter defluvii]
MNWGPPARVASDGGDGEILVYAKEEYLNFTKQTFHFYDYKMFYVNKKGKIYHWVTQRQHIPPMQIDLNVYKRN